MARALPLPTGAAKGLSRAVLLITHISAIIVPITEPLFVDAVSIVTSEISWRASLGNTAMVLIRSVNAVRVPITLPGIRDADTISLALKFI
jgi:hypothetical protein